MHVLDEYAPPRPEELAALKRSLGLTSPEMAKLTFLSQGAHWRRYTSVNAERPFGALMHFYMAALRTLPASTVEQVFATMREDGARLETEIFEPKAHQRESA